MILNKYAEIVNLRLAELLEREGINPLLKESMAYSLNAGGKRLRPVLNILAHLLRADDYAQTLDIACAIEMIHTYSLIHDDLPAMDNDDLRRGKPTNHKIFGEAQAILAGDGLLNTAFEVILETIERYPDANMIKAASIVAKSAGVSGMIAGQAADIAWEKQDISDEMLSYIHEKKTGAMITGALLSGIVAAGGSAEDNEAVKIYGENIGLAFQIIDDILDTTATDAELGKTPGKDIKFGKNTYVTRYGKEEAYRIAAECTRKACAALERTFGTRAAALIGIAQQMLNRKK